MFSREPGALGPKLQRRRQAGSCFRRDRFVRTKVEDGKRELSNEDEVGPDQLFGAVRTIRMRFGFQDAGGCRLAVDLGRSIRRRWKVRMMIGADAGAERRQEFERRMMEVRMSSKTKCVLR